MCKAKRDIAGKAGRLIVFEGASGTGKTTAARLLAAHLGGCYIYSIPSPFIELRDYVDGQQVPTLTLLFSLTSLIARCQEIRQVLAESDVVLDRYVDTVRFYSLAHGADLSIIDFGRLGLPCPDYVFALQTPDDERQRRLSSRGDHGAEGPLGQVVARFYRERSNFFYQEVTMLIDNSGSTKALVDAILPALRR